MASSKLGESLQDKPYQLVGLAGKTHVDPAPIVHSAAYVTGTFQFIPLIRMASSQQSWGEENDISVSIIYSFPSHMDEK